MKMESGALSHCLPPLRPPLPWPCQSHCHNADEELSFLLSALLTQMTMMEMIRSIADSSRELGDW
ncbi:hypothetical protein M5K25_018143 [Dendrobium thyrsiflorum]|uniref:Uncharacterized protein n=1 Tax=Dendrobium thyrsiflorum TaxID=117978 RepID=A0ABD0UI84_DENTH